MFHEVTSYAQRASGVGADTWNVEFYADEYGREPCREWANELSPQKRAAFTA
jgi:hypothetical protein